MDPWEQGRWSTPRLLVCYIQELGSYSLLCEYPLAVQSCFRQFALGFLQAASWFFEACARS